MNRNYLITGASSDVGCELIRAINQQYSGSTIYAHYRSSADNLNTIKEKNGNKIILVQANLANEMGVRSLLTQLADFAVVPNAVVHLPAPKFEFIRYKDLDWEECEKDLFVQVASIYKILQELLPKMIRLKEQSKIVFMLSENTINLPAKFTTKYTMSKYMLLGLMKSLTAEYQAKRVNINAVSPSMIDTKLLSNIDRRMLEVCGATDQILHPQDVVPTILGLLSEESDSMYGENIYITKRIASDE